MGVEISRIEKRGDAERLLRLREGDIAKGIPVSPQLGRFRFEDAAADIEAATTALRALAT